MARKRNASKNREYASQWRKDNPEKAKEMCRDWYKRNRERVLAKKKIEFQKLKEAGYSDKRRSVQMEIWRKRQLSRNCPNPLTSAERKQVFDESGRKCRNCKSDKNLTLDHIIPLSKGGFDTKTNVQVLCKSCNASKGNKIKNESCG